MIGQISQHYGSLLVLKLSFSRMWYILKYCLLVHTVPPVTGDPCDHLISFTTDPSVIRRDPISSVDLMTEVSCGLVFI